ncbi:RNA polymerase sigma-70 factor, ECF subfamily [Seinonella peptonophila]|uniref:RNA polymerase sigma-70 factor, ECF subfamily n=1 Tax=Seinonella peptonophila TaxID=112248 RepID=A0A1M5AXR2_9BACL|nr:sigma factor-like helix-turn-helix DNA-binding protein [Seinonella peptonophila]SHF35071.1 RNA polymerase sigma-70 factor, ECF subfamily [Seinonella peptonophila]
MKDLVKEYAHSLRKVRQAIKSLELSTKNTRDDAQLKILRNMERDLVYTIHLMKRQICASKRDLSRRSKSQREIPTDPNKMDYYSYMEVFKEPICSVTDNDRLKLFRVLQILSPHEKEVYILRNGQGFLHKEIASFLGVTEWNVQQTLKRAEQKIKRRVENMEIIDFYQNNCLK